jgi:hypothetical protein
MLMKMMLAATFGAYPRDEPSAGQPGPIILHFMSAMMDFESQSQDFGENWGRKGTLES